MAVFSSNADHCRLKNDGWRDHSEFEFWQLCPHSITQHPDFFNAGFRNRKQGKSDRPILDTQTGETYLTYADCTVATGLSEAQIYKMIRFNNRFQRAKLT